MTQCSIGENGILLNKQLVYNLVFYLRPHVSQNGMSINKIDRRISDNNLLSFRIDLLTMETIEEGMKEFFEFYESESQSRYIIY